MKSLTSYLIYFSFLLFFWSCANEEKEFIPDVSDIEVDMQVRRFEQDLFRLDTLNFAVELASLEQNYPDFSTIYFGNILRSKDPYVAPDGHDTYVEGFVKHPSVQKLYETTAELYDDFSGLEASFAEAFKFYKYYFPDRPTPDLTTFISEYSIGAFIYKDNSLAVGLDYFLGEDYPYRQINPQDPAFSGYLTRTFNKDHLVSKAVQPMIEDMVGPVRGEKMLDHMIHNGKKLYLLDLLLPHAPDSVIFEITGEQVDWLDENQLEMWAYFLKENLLYSTTWQDIRKFVDYSPHSPGMPPEAPGRTANWVGYQIIKSYLRRNPETHPQTIIEMDDAQKILDLSKYKPRRK